MPPLSVIPHECSAYTSVTEMPSASMVPPWLPPMILSASSPLEPSHALISWFVTIVCFVRLAISRASWMLSKWPCVMSIRSHLSTFLSCSGATGLFMTHGSMRISLPLALRTFQVPCPTHVKMTSAFSAIPAPLCLPEKTIFPHGQNENPDAADRPQVRKEQLARLPDEAKQADRQDRERDPPPALDRFDQDKKRDRQQWQPLIGPDLVRDDGAKREADGHAVDGIPSAAPRRPGRSDGKRQRARIRKDKRQS